MKTTINKYPFKLKADPGRVIALPSIYPGLERVKRMYKRIAETDDATVDQLIAEVSNEFGDRHRDLDHIFNENYQFFRKEYELFPELNKKKQALLGASLTKEYSIQSAALFNPSIVPHPDQSKLSDGQQRFVMSTRSTGERHISSIEFRTGIVDKSGELELDETSKFAMNGTIIRQHNETDYEITYPDNSSIDERVLFPQTDIESRGMEDLRLVAFSEAGETTYYGTYTAYNGLKIHSQLLSTQDFQSFSVRTLKGDSALDKGMALFPEKINEKYAMVSRQGGESISIMFSDDLCTWNDHQLLMEPVYPFEYSQLGNCGSPHKTSEGWLLLTHGVGPMRKYTISAALLDLDDPSKVRARLDRPLIEATGEEREGYVPNVVYTCGSMMAGNKLYVPYAMSDSMIGFCWLDVNKLLKELL